MSHACRVPAVDGRVRGEAGLGLPVSQPDEIATRYDAVVIGSGYGGGVAACRLARAGLSVCVLEQGRHVEPGGFPTTPIDLVRETEYRDGQWRFGSRLSLFQLHYGEDMHVLCGRGVGGGSLVNAAVAMRPDFAALKARGWPRDLLDDPRLIAGFERAEAMLGVGVDRDAAAQGTHRSLTRAAAALGAEVEPVATAIAHHPRPTPSGADQPACSRCGDCWSGCNTGAKTTVAISYLADAAAHGARIFEHSRVSQVRRDGAEWQVAVQPIDGRGGLAVGEGRTVRAPLVVVAAGAIGSTEILLRSRAAGLAISDRLGHGFSGNGDDLAVITDLPHEVHGVALGTPPRRADAAPPGVNTCGMMRVRDAASGHEMLFQAGMVPHILARHEVSRALLTGRIGRAVRMLREGPYAGRRARMQAFYVVGHDSAAGRLVLDRETIRLEWPGVAAEDTHAAADRMADRLADALGGVRHPAPLPTGLLRPRKVTVHPLGGCGIGADARSGVVDHRGHVFDPSRGVAETHAGLLVVDAAVMPGSLGANPLLTITAFAERSMEDLLTRRPLVLRH